MTTRIKFDNGQEIYQHCGTLENQDPFFAGFLARLYTRPSCHDCKARNFTSGSDIQLGDFWGIEKVNPNFCDKSDEGTALLFGVSEVIPISEKGKRIFDEISKEFKYFKLDKDWFLKSKSFGNYFILHDSIRPNYKRELFLADFKKDKTAVSALIRKHLKTFKLNSNNVTDEYTTCRDLSYELIIGRKLDRFLLEKGFKNIAIYGYGDIGFLVDKALRDSEVCVEYLIDRTPIFTDKRVRGANEDIPETVEAIVICVPHFNDTIEAFLKEKTDIPLIPVSDLIFYA